MPGMQNMPQRARFRASDAACMYSSSLAAAAPYPRSPAPSPTPCPTSIHRNPTASRPDAMAAVSAVVNEKLMA